MLELNTDRQALLQQFCGFARAIADHPNFAHHYLCHIALPDGEYDRVDNAAEREWNDGVKAGRFPDNLDAMDEYVTARITADIALSPECAKLADEYRTMLRTLVIPPGWLEREGLS